MEFKSLATVIVKTAGLILVLYALVVAPERIATYSYQLSSPAIENPRLLFLGLVVLPTVVPLLAGLLLFLSPGWVASLVIGSRADEVSGDGAEPALLEGLQSLIFGGIGLYVLVEGLLDLIYLASLHLYMRDYAPNSGLPSPVDIANLITALASLLVGGGLLFGARGLVRTVSRLRRRGVE